MAHCADSNEASPGAGQHADPEFWRRAMIRHPGLRVQLGHFGGAGEMVNDPDASWAGAIARLMEAQPQLYADTGYHDESLSSKMSVREAYRGALAHLAGQQGAVVNQLLYGSDWHMIVLESGWKRYLSAQRDDLRAALGEAGASQVMGPNALRMHGLLGTPTKPRARLLRFYERHGIRTAPPWWTGAWPLA